MSSLLRKEKTTHEWASLANAKTERKIWRFADRWVGTPYLCGNRARQGGVDCAQLIAAFMDFMYDAEEPTILPRMSPDTGVHNQSAAWRTVAALRRVYDYSVIESNVIQPGDVILTRATFDIDGPPNIGHAIIAMPRDLTGLHAYPLSGVNLTTLSHTKGILKVFRFKGMEKNE